MLESTDLVINFYQAQYRKTTAAIRRKRSGDEEDQVEEWTPGDEASADTNSDVIMLTVTGLVGNTNYSIRVIPFVTFEGKNYSGEPTLELSVQTKPTPPSGRLTSIQF